VDREIKEAKKRRSQRRSSMGSIATSTPKKRLSVLEAIRFWESSERSEESENRRDVGPQNRRMSC